jgi:hypothetical protein
MKENGIGEACGMHGQDEKCIQNLIRKPERKRLLVIPIRIWEVNIKWILEKQGVMTRFTWVRLGANGRFLQTQ